MEWHLPFAVGASIVTGFLFAYVGHALGVRQPSEAVRPALTMFRVWWYTLAASSLLSPLMLALHAAGRLEVWLYQTFIEVILILICVALWALLCYLIYLYTGSRRAWVPLGLAYAVIAVALLGLIAKAGVPERIALDTGHWELEAQPDADFPHWYGVALVVGLVGPQIGAALAYMRLYTRTSDPTQRYRIALVSGSIAVWFGTSLLAALGEAAGTAWEVASRLIGIAAASVILVAYFPPRFLRQRWRLRSLADEAPPAAADANRR